MTNLRIAPEELEIVRGILRTHLPGYEILAFGSRVHGENLKSFSDLDLVVVTKSPLAPLKMAEIQDAFSDSDLPFKVDVLDWSMTDKRFKEQIRKNALVVVSSDQVCWDTDQI